LSSVVPFLVAVFQADSEKARDIASSLELDEQDIAFLISEGKAEAVPKGQEQILDPAGFKLPYMGKDKFVQLMRAGLTYDRKGGKFVVRRLDNLDSVEERVSQIISKPVKFKRPEQTVGESVEGDITKECYVDSRPIICAKCEFVDDCPTHTISALRFCLCDETLADPASYDEYVAKRAPISKTPKRTERHRKRA
jgi:hypothetical protein